MSSVLAVAVVLAGAIKVADFVAASGFVYRRRHEISTLDGVAQIDFGWTPIFAWAIAKRRRWKADGLEGSLRDRLLSILIDGVFRAPVLTLLQALGIFAAVGSFDGHPQSHGASCAYPADLSISSWLLVTAGVFCVLVAATGILTLLLVALIAPSGDFEINAGQYLVRSKGSDDDREPFGSVLVVPAVTLALILSFAALYLVLFAIDRSALQVSPCNFGPVAAIYFSASIGATVGFGDIVAVSDAARLAVTCEVIFFVTLVALFLQTLRRVGPQR